MPEISRLGNQLVAGFDADGADAAHAVAGEMVTGMQIAPLAEPSLARVTANATAFVGRALRGPINTPIYVTSIAEYQQIFGGLWQPSPLSYAIEQFFEQGGKRAVVVRVTNHASPVSLKIPCGKEFLHLEAKAPGSREYLRASIDYDNIAAADTDRFNLILQRLRASGSERIEEQEIFRDVSTDTLAERYVALVLVESNLVRVRGPVPNTRPNSTMANGTFLPLAYIESNPDGDDGAPLCDYDIIGSSTRRTGLFALEGIDDLGFIYIPPLSRTQDVGITTLLVAARFCHAHRAILIVDPPSPWTSPERALTGLREFPFRGENAVMFYPRLAVMDRLRGHQETFGNGGAVAGMLARAEGMRPIWAMFTPEPELALRGTVRLAGSPNETERARLAAAGINILNIGRSTGARRRPTRTLAGGANSSADWGYLTTLRFGQMVIRSIERGTRWVAGATRDPTSWRRVCEQVEQFFISLAEAGAFPNASAEHPYGVLCDERINTVASRAAGETHLLVYFACLHTGDLHAYRVTHSVKGSSCVPVAVNRLELPKIKVDTYESFDDESDSGERLPPLLDESLITLVPPRR